MRRPDRGALRSGGFVVLLTTVFVVVNSQVVYAADTSGSGSGDLLAPLNITSSEGVSINGYELNASGGSIVAFKSQALAFALSGLFTLIRLLVGLAGWAVELAFRFPLLKILTRPAQKVADAWDGIVVDTLGLKGLLLAWAFVFAAFMIVRGKVGRGLGEIFLTLLIAAFAASTFVRPDYLLSQDGPLGQGQQVAADVAQQSVNSYEWGGKLAGRGPCDGMAGPAELKCFQQDGGGPVSAAEVARPIQDSITNALIVKPYMLLQYGRILDPAKASDLEAYAVHLKWVTGGYQAGAVKDDKDDPCGLLKGPAKKWCQREHAGQSAKASLPEFTPGGQLLDTANPVVSEEDQEFAAFLADLKRAGPVGRSCAAYAEKPTWWRVGGTALLVVAALFICGMLLSAAIVLLGTQAGCAAAAAAGGITFIAGMLPGPPRQSVWKWLSLWGIAVLTMVGLCAFLPFFGIAVDATITDGPDLLVERILLIDVLAIAGTAGHRRLLAGIASFGQRMAMRMRYAKVGGTHMPGDTSELGAALAMNSSAGSGAYGGGLRSLVGGRGGRFAMLGTRHRLMGAVSSLVDGTGMPVDPGRILSDATAEAGRGLAPLTAAAAVGGLGVRMGAKGAYGLLVGRRPDREQLAKWQKPTADSDVDGGRPTSGGLRAGGSRPRLPSGPGDRYRNADGQVVDRRSGDVLHDQDSDRTLLSTRAHNRLVRFRGYRILHRGGRATYGATVGLPATLRRAGGARSQYTHDARQQVRVWGNTVREDVHAWSSAGNRVRQTMRENTGDRGAPAPFTHGSRLPTAPAPAVRTPAAAAAPGAAARSSVARRIPPAAQDSSPRRSTPAGSPVRPPQRAGRPPDGAQLPGVGRTGSQARNEARERMRDLMRRTAPEAERLRRAREQRRRRGQSDNGQEEGV
ncbi:hypothetical protein EAO69_39345 [Streptomyces sp. me109]|uniref:hypothetical protein n=1 Tax=Streptomyces sp. me109 TaxID=1827853 RepID=UPI0011CDBDFE|nr:hypothetical protein [Streptomyces sp. me109]TXS61405.1 hypothetical protein EAO69_39345 [Streptomyces sp. me109]